MNYTCESLANEGNRDLCKVISKIFKKLTEVACSTKKMDVMEVAFM